MFDIEDRLDRLNERRNPVVMRAAGICFKTADDQILFVRRSAGSDHSGEWCFPGGGLEGSETPEGAALREVSEETGWSAGCKLEDVLHQEISPEGVDYTTFLACLDAPFTPDLNHEHTDSVWAPVGALPAPLHPGVAVALRKLKGRQPMANDDKWTTVHPNGEGGGTPVLLGANGEVKAGMGGKFNGKNISDIKNSEPSKESSGSSRSSSAKSNPQLDYINEERARYTKLSDLRKKHGEKSLEYRKAAKEIGLHPLSRREIKERFGELSQMETKERSVAQDRGLAFDRATVRNRDADGRLHVEITNISKSNVCPYVGHEIPAWQELGLEAGRIYNLLRDPAELERAAPTFNNLPLLSDHIPVSAAAHHPELVIGSTGTDAVFEPPYLKNSLVVWAALAISDIEAGMKKELSSAYRYRADMTPGVFEGVRYDGVMRDIVGNHVALVKEGRAGADVVVGDSNEEVTMAKKVTGTALLMQGALAAYLAPKLALDAKIDVRSKLLGLTPKNYSARRPAIEAEIRAQFEALRGENRIAQDAGIEDLVQLLDAMSTEPALADATAGDTDPLDIADGETGSGQPVDGDPESGIGNPQEKEGPAEDADPSAKALAFLQGKISDEDLAQVKQLLTPAAAEDEGETPSNSTSAGGGGGESDGSSGSGVTMRDPSGGATDGEKDESDMDDNVKKPAMDAAIKKATADATAAATRIGIQIREAEKFVRPWVGDIAIACDSADNVFKTALKALGKNVDDVHPSAYKFILENTPKPGEGRTTKPVSVAMDAAAADDFAKRFPAASRIRLA